jgi:hypothetical protein
METTNGETTNGHAGTPHTLGAHVDEIRRNARHLVVESRGLVTDVRAALDIPGRMERHPYRTLLVGAGIGYVLGGGLFTALTFAILRTGLKVAAIPVVRGQLMALAENALLLDADPASTPSAAR